MKNVKDKIALVTGAGTGIGRAVCLELARRGAIPYVSALSLAEAQTVVDEIIAEGNRAQAIELDVTNDTQFRETIQSVKDREGRIDILFNNAGVVYNGEFFDMSDEFMRTIIDVNLRAVAMGTLYAYRVMKEQGSGLILNMSSSAGIVAAGAMAAYTATKHGVYGLSEAVAGEAKAFGVDVKVVCPGNIVSELFAKGQNDGTSPEEMLKNLPALRSTASMANYIVDGICTKKSVLFYPWYARVLWIIQRVWPGFGRWGANHTMKQFRLDRQARSK